MNKIFFSVVIPTHNRSNLLKIAVESVLNQNFQNFEIIVVDDQSTDDTAALAESIPDSRFRYLKNQRSKGACGARNTGIFVARGEWVAFLDDDDEWLPEKLDLQYQLITHSRRSVGLVCSDYLIKKNNEKKLKTIENRPSGWVRDKLLYGGIIGCLSSTCIKLDILKKINGFDENFSSNQDQDLWLRVACESEFSHVPKPLVKMNQEDRKDRIGVNFNKKLKGWILLRNKYSDIIKKSLRLRSRFETEIFIYAFLQKDYVVLSKSIPLFLLGILLDMPYFLRAIRTSVILSYNKSV